MTIGSDAPILLWKVTPPSGGAQLWAAPLKITVGALAAALLCYPSLYIFSCIAGADARPAGTPKPALWQVNSGWSQRDTPARRAGLPPE